MWNPLALAWQSTMPVALKPRFEILWIQTKPNRNRHSIVVVCHLQLNFSPSFYSPPTISTSIKCIKFIKCLEACAELYLRCKEKTQANLRTQTDCHSGSIPQFLFYSKPIKIHLLRWTLLGRPKSCVNDLWKTFCQNHPKWNTETVPFDSFRKKTFTKRFHSVFYM